jgi:hypothetical protein
VNFKTQIKTVGVCILALVFVGCAKDLPEEYPENFKRDYLSTEIFSEEVVLETTSPVLDQNAAVLIKPYNDLLLLKDQNLYQTKIVKGSEGVSHLFQDLVLDASQSGETFSFKLKLTKAALIGYVKLDKKTVKGKDVLSAGSVKLDNSASFYSPVFKYPIASFGILKPKKDSNEMEYKETPRDVATHLKMTGTVDARTKAGLREHVDLQLIDKSKLQNKVWGFNEVLDFLNLPASQVNKLQNTPLISKVLDDQLYFYLPKVYSELTRQEEKFLTENDPRITLCPKTMVSSLDLTNFVDTPDLSALSAKSCISVAVYKFPIQNIAFENELNDANDYTGKVNLLKNVPNSSSQFFEIKKHSLMSEVKLKDILGVYESFFNLGVVKNKNWDGKTLSTILGVEDLAKEEVLKTTIHSQFLFVLKPVSLSTLSMVEQIATGKDPRYKACGPKILKASGLKKEDCILKPIFTQKLVFAEYQFVDQSHSDIPAIKITATSKRDPKTTVLIIPTDSKPAPFKYDELANISPNKIVTRVSNFDTDADFLYVPMTMGTPREVKMADPFYQGSEKIVKMKWSNKGLEIYEMDPDKRFESNPLNSAPVLTIKGEFASFTCDEDVHGECGKKVGLDDKITNDKKDLFYPNLENLQVDEVNSLDLFTVSSGGCVQKTGTKLVSYQIDNDTINIELEKKFKLATDFSCIFDNYLLDTEGLSGLRLNGFNVRYFYSVKRLSKVASSNYQAVNYPKSEHSIFGFFKTKSSKLDDIFDTSRKKTKYFLNRWNPKNKVVKYVLSDSFNKKQNKMFKDATYASFKRINQGLKKANSPIKLKLVEPNGSKAGDLGVNMIVLIDDPLSNGLLGYGPTVTNPRTGEIVQGHVNMYSGVLKTMTRRVWNEMRDLSIKQKEKTNALNGGGIAPAVSSTTPTAPSNGPETRSLLNGLGIKAKLHKTTIAKEAKFSHAHSDFPHELSTVLKIKQKELLRLKKDVEVPSRIKFSDIETPEGRKKIYEQRLERYAKNNAYPAEEFNIAGTAKHFIPQILTIGGVLDKNGILKEWEQLRKAQKRIASKIITLFAYNSTLIHEVGHNLGLRHNFSGSTDKDNFYNQKEAEEMGLTNIPAYSSIMDYSFSELNQLQALGSYDIAALRFAYAREFEAVKTLKADGTRSGNPVPLSNTETITLAKEKAEEIKSLIDQAKDEGDMDRAKLLQKQYDRIAPHSYSFCTDGNAGLSTLCNRFDEGTTLVEIAKHRIERYNDNYKYRNRRDKRDDFTSYGLQGYLFARHREFSAIRQIYEEFERFQNIFGLDLMVSGCSADQLKDPQYTSICTMVNDRRDAALLVGQFFVDILKTPDHICLVQTEATPKPKMELVKLNKLYEDVQYTIDYVPSTCFDKAIQEKIKPAGQVVIAEAGRFLNGIKSNSPEHEYQSDRDVRGVWIDKLLAMRFIHERIAGAGSVETYHNNLMDHPEISTLVEEYINHIVLQTPLESPLPLINQAGVEFPYPYEIDANYVIHGTNDSLRFLRYYFDLPVSGKARLIPTLLKQIPNVGYVKDIDTFESSFEDVNYVTVRKRDIDFPYKSDAITYWLNPDDEIIYGATKKNTLAFAMLNLIDTDKKMSSIDTAAIDRAIDSKKNVAMPGGLTPEQVVGWEIGNQVLEMLLPLAQSGAVLDEQLVINAFGAELAKKVMLVYAMGADAITEMIAINSNAELIVPNGTPKEEAFLYTQSMEVLNAAKSGVLKSISDNYKKSLMFLPKNVRNPLRLK